MVAGLALAVATRPRGHGTNADEELLNLVEDRILVSKVWKIVTARKFDDLRARVLELLTPLQHEGYRIVTKDLLSHNGSAGFDNYADVICTAYPLFDKASQRRRGRAICHEIYCATLQLAAVNW